MSTTSSREITTSLEKHYRDMQDFEFTIQDGKLYMLQTRNGKRTGPAAVRVAVEMVEEGLITKKEAVLRVDPQQLDQLLHPVFDPASLKKLTKLATGIAGIARRGGRHASSSPPMMRWRWRKNGPVILVRKETTPDDIHGMEVAKGILTARRRHDQPRGRGRARHGHVPASPAPARSPINEHEQDCHRHGRRQDDHAQGRRLDFARRHDRRSLSRPGQDQRCRSELAGVLQSFMEWADEFRGNFGVRANADIPRDAKVARAFGAEGIGLCRTEHMFFAEDRIAAHAGHDSGARREEPPQGAAEAAAHAAQGFRRPVQGHGRLPGRDPHARSAAARVPAEARRPDGGPRQAAVRRRARRRRKCREKLRHPGRRI